MNGKKLTLVALASAIFGVILMDGRVLEDTEASFSSMLGGEISDADLDRLKISEGEGETSENAEQRGSVSERSDVPAHELTSDEVAGHEGISPADAAVSGYEGSTATGNSVPRRRNTTSDGNLPGYEGARVAAPVPSKDPLRGADLARWFFEEWHRPYPGILEPPELERIWSNVEALPSEDEIEGERAVNSWQALGPYGMRNADGGRWTGRILDIEAESASSIRVAAASGGLWEFFVGFPVPLTENLKSQCVSTFDTHPHDSQTIIVGTGEPDVTGGAGLYKRTGSTDWSKKPMSPEPSGFYRHGQKMIMYFSR